MALRRLRLRLTQGFGLAFLVSLGLLDASLYAWLGHGAEQRFTAALQATAQGVATNIVNEVQVDHAGPDEAYAEVLGEWPLEGRSAWVVDE